ncbi:MAG TPA: zinc ribbon domain-containing protein [Gemmatimonadaceae bacterium]
MFRPKGPVCQSCGMPLSKDPLGGGTNADGSLSSEYCSHCYRKGVFTQPNITAQEMTALVEGKLRSMHFPRFLARRFAKEVPTLRRWRNKGATQDPARPSSGDLQPRA